MRKFEYKFELNVGEPEFGVDYEEGTSEERQLNQFGAEGWELVAVNRCGKDFSYLGFWFKREIAG
jgi:hypothetical protein